MNDKKTYEIFELADAYQGSAVLFFALKSGVFDILENPMTCEEVAENRKWVNWKATILLNSLVSLELLEKVGNYFKNTSLSSKVLVKKKPTFQGDIIEHERLQWKLWDSIDEIMCSEQTTQEQQNIRLEQESYDNNIFHNAMLQLADELIDYVLLLDDWKNKKKVIDLAGGHGLYLAKLIKQFPSIKGEVWDFESAKQSALEVFKIHKIEEKANFIIKDITLKSSYEGVQCDGILINHCLHHFTPQQVSEIISNCVSILEKGGIITFIESYLESNLTKPKDNAMFSLYMMINRQFGQVHSTDWIANELRKYDLDVSVKRLNNPGDDALIVAKK